MKIIDVVQGSADWLQARAGIVTASEMDNLITPTGKVAAGKAVETYLYRKLAEKWIGGPLPTTYSGGGLEQGHLKETDAIPWYELTYNRNIAPIGFVTTDDGRVGCSPDGMFAHDGAEGAILDGDGIEVKCPDLHTHIGYLLGGELPSAYMPQVQASMLVTGAPGWTFLSYCPKLPPLILVIERNEGVFETMCKALDAFCERLDAGYARLVELNKGEPTRPAPATVAGDDDDGNTLDIL